MTEKNYINKTHNTKLSEEIKSLKQEIKRLKKQFERLIRGAMAGKRLTGDHNLIRKNGEEFPVSVNSSIIENTDGKIIGCFGEIRDTTNEKIAENERLKLQKIELTETLAGGIAHDFNNLLAVIIGNISLVKRTASQNLDKALELISKTERGVLNAKGLTNQLLTFAKGGLPIFK